MGFYIGVIIRGNLVLYIIVVGARKKWGGAFCAMLRNNSYLWCTMIEHLLHLLVCERFRDDARYRGGISRGTKESNLSHGLRKVKHNFRLFSSYPSEVLWSPLFKLWHLFWRKSVDMHVTVQGR